MAGFRLNSESLLLKQTQGYDFSMLLVIFQSKTTSRNKSQCPDLSETYSVV